MASTAHMWFDITHAKGLRCTGTDPGDEQRTFGWIFRCPWILHLSMSIDWSKCFDRVPQGFAFQFAERQGLHPRVLQPFVWHVP